MKAIQSYEHFGKYQRDDAYQAFDALSCQDGFLGGRVLEPIPSKPTWRVQTFYEHVDCDCLPDGMRHVIILDSQKQMLGIIKYKEADNGKMF